MIGFHEEELLKIARDANSEYTNANPFPHAIFDGLFPGQILDDVLNEFPAPGDAFWGKFDSAVDKKLVSEEPWNIPQGIYQ